MAFVLRRAPPRPEPAGRHWYTDADPEERREYDAFGPWIGEIAAERDMPRRFRAFWPRVSDARFLLKIPIEVERARVRPGADLYRAVLAVTDAGITCLSRVGDAVSVEDRRWDAVVAVRSYANLLLGRWSLLTADGGRLDIGYNTVSSRTMEAVTEFVRDHIAWRASAGVPGSDAVHAGLPESDVPDPGTRDFGIPDPGDLPAAVGPEVTEPLFRYVLFHLRRAGPQPVTVLHNEPGGRWCDGGGAWRRLSTARMVAATPAELILVDRDQPTRPFWLAHYASAVTTVPWRRLTGFAFGAAPDGRLPRFRDLTLRLDAAEIRFPCLDEPTAVMATLARRGLPRLDA